MYKISKNVWAIACIFSLLYWNPTYGQTRFGSIIKGAKTAVLPYHTLNQDRSYYKERKILYGADSIFFMNVFFNTMPFRINPYGGTAFGNMDCDKEWDCAYKFEDITEVAIMAVIKNSDHYLVHLHVYQDIGWGTVMVLWS